MPAGSPKSTFAPVAKRSVGKISLILAGKSNLVVIDFKRGNEEGGGLVSERVILLSMLAYSPACREDEFEGKGNVTVVRHN